MTPLKADGSALVAEYAIDCATLLAHEGKALAYCVFNAQGLLSARACPDLIVWPSLHSILTLSDAVADHFAEHGLKRGMSHHAALVTLSKHHPAFEPEQ